MNPLSNVANVTRQLLSILAFCWVAALASAQQGTPAAEAAAQNAIESLQVSQQGGGTVVKLTLKQALTGQPASFSISNPARLVFDFAATANNLGRNAQQVNEGELRSINIVQVADRTRLVLNLRQMTAYQTRLEGNAMIINFAPPETVGSKTAPPVVASFEATKPQDSAQSLRDINFRRGKNGEARITVELSDPNVGIDIRKLDGNLVVDFKKTNLPANLNRRLDVTDFATPVTTITTQTQGDSVRMAIAPRGLWDHSAYQSENQFVIEVSPIAAEPNKLVQGSGAGAQGEKLSLNFQNIDVRAVLQVIADFTNFNIITSDTVSGNVTLRLKDVPWDQALEIILQAKGLGMQKTGNVIWIATVEEIIKRNEEVTKARKAASMSEAIEMRAFQINYHKADEVVKFITGEKTGASPAQPSIPGAAPAASAAPAGGATAQGGGERMSNLSSSGTLSVDLRSNLIIVNDYPTYLERIRQLIAQIDKPVRQVLIEARIVSASDDFGRSIGVRLGYNDLRSTVPGAGIGTRIAGTNTYATVGGSYSAVSSLTGQNVGGGTSTPFATSGSTGSTGTLAPPASTPMVNVPATGNVTGQMVVSLFNSSLTQFINLEITAAENDTRVKSIASPRVITENGKAALISQGVQIPYQTDSGISGKTTSFKPAVLKLSVTPQITPNGTVTLDVDVSQDTKGEDTTAGPVINSKQITTRVSVENGGTVVLGGIYTQDDSKGTDKVPVLGDIPVLGNLFKNSTRTQSKKELLVFITPKIINEQIQVGVR
ncbi:MAG: type IV pilus secretin PilQ [Betaproteobacteria bacterium]|nr:type IV pilus secretin PilQ [Betaproteobacteria bacterium]